MLLDITHEQVETRTHGIVHLKQHVEEQDAELEERAEIMMTVSSRCWSFRRRHHLSMSTTRRLMPCQASMRIRSHRC
jgi:hypothetical protein